MKETVINGYLKVKLIPHKSFFSTEGRTYEEMGIVIAKDKKITDIPIGATVLFDSFMAKKYAIEGDEENYDWFINKDEVVAFKTNAKPKI